MTIEITFDTDVTEGGVVPEPLNGDDVWYQYCTQHDNRVRPSHAALDGTVWRADDVSAPTPPIAYGCRCYLTYVAAPGSRMASALPQATTQPITVAQAFAKHLDEVVPAWRKIADKVMALAAPLRAEAAFLDLQAAYPAIISADLRDLAVMVTVAAGERHG